MHRLIHSAVHKVTQAQYPQAYSQRFAQKFNLRPSHVRKLPTGFCGHKNSRCIEPRPAERRKSRVQLMRAVTRQVPHGIAHRLTLWTRWWADRDVVPAIRTRTPAAAFGGAGQRVPARCADDEPEEFALAAC